MHETESYAFRCTGPASTVFDFIPFHVALGINLWGLLNTQQTGLRVLSGVFIAGNHTKIFCDMIASIL